MKEWLLRRDTPPGFARRSLQSARRSAAPAAWRTRCCAGGRSRAEQTRRACRRAAQTTPRLRPGTPRGAAARKRGKRSPGRGRRGRARARSRRRSAARCRPRARGCRPTTAAAWQVLDWEAAVLPLSLRRDAKRTAKTTNLNSTQLRAAVTALHSHNNAYSRRPRATCWRDAIDKKIVSLRYESVLIFSRVQLHATAVGRACLSGRHVGLRDQAVREVVV